MPLTEHQIWQSFITTTNRGDRVAASFYNRLWFLVATKMSSERYAQIQSEAIGFGSRS
jgi:hypothetical protein